MMGLSMLACRLCIPNQSLFTKPHPCEMVSGHALSCCLTMVMVLLTSAHAFFRLHHPPSTAAWRRLQLLGKRRACSVLCNHRFQAESGFDHGDLYGRPCECARHGQPDASFDAALSSADLRLQRLRKETVLTFDTSKYPFAETVRAVLHMRRSRQLPRRCLCLHRWMGGAYVRHA